MYCDLVVQTIVIAYGLEGGSALFFISIVPRKGGANFYLQNEAINIKISIGESKNANPVAAKVRANVKLLLSGWSEKRNRQGHTVLVVCQKFIHEDMHQMQRADVCSNQRRSIALFLCAVV